MAIECVVYKSGYSSRYMNKLHDQISIWLGGTPGDYQIESRSEDGYLRVTTALEGVAQASLNAVVNGHHALTLITDKPVLMADGNDVATIVCSDVAIVGDSAIDFTVWLDGEVYTEPSGAAVEGGQLLLTLTTNEPGEYLVEVRRQGSGNYQTGYIIIIAEE